MPTVPTGVMMMVTVPTVVTVRTTVLKAVKTMTTVTNVVTTTTTVTMDVTEEETTGPELIPEGLSGVNFLCLFLPILALLLLLLLLWFICHLCHQKIVKVPSPTQKFGKVSDVFGPDVVSLPDAHTDPHREASCRRWGYVLPTPPAPTYLGRESWQKEDGDRKAQRDTREDMGLTDIT
ncbi:hypothetical protein Cadr_000008926 [Camelus dromedarius]|uniref:Uncharacterized protein n=1 Tax=Camelus dromedarius TaxID=9838 RepID=A0A5N4DKH5_CAMDR|nr:hypothetical protein Cadr_000008926 [Camelus dromedarius]